MSGLKYFLHRVQQVTFNNGHFQTRRQLVIMDTRCKYAYKECSNERTSKRDGQLHRLCEYHRNKANALQKVYATKRRRELRAQKRQAMEEKHICKIEPVPFHNDEATIKLESMLTTTAQLNMISDLDGIFDDTDDIEPLESHFTEDSDSISEEEYAYLLSVVL